MSESIREKSEREANTLAEEIDPYGLLSNDNFNEMIVQIADALEEKEKKLKIAEEALAWISNQKRPQVIHSDAVIFLESITRASEALKKIKDGE